MLIHEYVLDERTPSTAALASSLVGVVLRCLYSTVQRKEFI